MSEPTLRRFLLPLLLAVALSPRPGLAKDRTITIANTCTYTLWMAYFTSVGPQPDQVTGWEAPSGTVVTMTVQETWGGRVWARTNCDFTSDQPDYAQCETGGCNGGLECDKSTGTGVGPVTLAEFNIQTDVDNYDVSNVDGFNVAVAVTNSGSCPLSNCPFDLLLNCPSDLQKKDDAGTIIGCYTDCGATNKDEYCCAGDYNLPSTCPSANIPNYKWWKDNCPIAYAYAYDESSGTALFTCTDQVDYTITFCPSDSLYDDTAVLPDGSTISQGSGTPASTVAITGTGAGSGSGGGSAATTTAAGGDNAATTTAGAAAGASTTSGGGAPAKTGGSSKVSSGGGATGTKASGTAASGGGATSAAGGTGASATSSSTSSSSSSGDTILGMSKTVAIGVAAVVVVLIIAGIAAALFFSQNKDRKHKHHRAKDSDSSDDDDSKGSDTETGSSGGSSDDDGKRR